MNNPHNNIEKLLKKTATRVSASRANFDALMHGVTNSEFDRNTISKARMLSPYQSFVFSMKKIVAIGLPIAVLALLVVSKVHKNGTVDTVATLPTGTTTHQTLTKDSSIDDIIASYDAEADADAAVANGESQDDAAIQSQLQDYNDIKSYEI